MLEKGYNATSLVFMVGNEMVGATSCLWHRGDVSVSAKGLSGNVGET